MTRRELGAMVGVSLILWAVLLAGGYGIWLGIR